MNTTLLKNRSFFSIWLGQSLFNFALIFYIIAMITMLFSKNSSLLDATLFPLTRHGAAWMGGMLAPGVIQRVPLCSFLIAVQWVQITLMLGLAIYLTQFKMNIFVMLPFIIGISFLEGWNTPARSAIIPFIVDKEDLVRANSWLTTSTQVTVGAGFYLGGFTDAMFGATSCVWVSAALLTVAGLFFVCIKAPIQDSKEHLSRWEGFKETWSFAYRHPLYRKLFILDSLEYIAGAAWAGAIILVFVQSVLGQSKDWWGYLHGSYFVGTAIGGVIAIRINSWLKERLKTAFIVGSANLGALTFLLALSPFPSLCLLAAILMGIPYQMRDIALQTLIQANADRQMLPRIASVHSAIASISVVIGITIMSILAKYFSSQTALLLSGALTLLSAWMAKKLPVKQ